MFVADLKAHYLLKKNVDALLKARQQTRKELAFFCRRSEAWISKIFGSPNRNIPLKYLDRIADFFGLATYQLFQPGISPLTERRKGKDRRTGRDRRVSRVTEVLQPTPKLADLEREVQKLSPEEYRAWVRRAFDRLLRPVLADTAPPGPEGSGGPPVGKAPRTHGRR
jgi:transcriptional regulator with XRE-family HTH domain